MKKKRGKRKYIFAMISIIVLISGILATVYYLDNGNPYLIKESKEIVTEYLQSNFPEHSFSVDGVGYYPGEGTYIVHFISKDGSIQGLIDVRDGKIVGEGEFFKDEIEISPDELK